MESMESAATLFFFDFACRSSNGTYLLVRFVAFVKLVRALSIFTLSLPVVLVSGGKYSSSETEKSESEPSESDDIFLNGENMFTISTRVILKPVNGKREWFFVALQKASEDSRT